MHLTRAQVLIVPTLLGLALVAAFAYYQPRTPDAGTEAIDLAPGSAAMTATLTPEGTIEVSTRGGSLALDAELRNALRRDSEGLVPTVHPNGAVSVNLQGRFQSASVARLDANGKVFVCSEESSAIEHVLNTQTSTAWEVQ